MKKTETEKCFYCEDSDSPEHTLFEFEKRQGLRNGTKH